MSIDELTVKNAIACKYVTSKPVNELLLLSVQFTSRYSVFKTMCLVVVYTA